MGYNRAKANKLKVNLKSIAAIIPSDPNMFPYWLPDGTLNCCSSCLVSNHSFILLGTPAVICVKASNQLTAFEGECTTICPLCDMRVINMRNHVGHHILCALTNTLKEPPLKQKVSLFLYQSSYFTNVKQVGLTSLCGFCSCSGVPECTIRIMVPSSRAPTWELGYKYKHTLRYGSVDSGSKNKPSSAAFVTLCSLLNPARAHEKYPFSHLALQHGSTYPGPSQWVCCPWTA
jgi:hypothetical protein